MTQGMTQGTHQDPMTYCFEKAYRPPRKGYSKVGPRAPLVGAALGRLCDLRDPDGKPFGDGEVAVDPTVVLFLLVGLQPYSSNDDIFAVYRRPVTPKRVNAPGKLGVILGEARRFFGIKKGSAGVQIDPNRYNDAWASLAGVPGLGWTSRWWRQPTWNSISNRDLRELNSRDWDALGDVRQDGFLKWTLPQYIVDRGWVRPFPLDDSPLTTELVSPDALLRKECFKTWGCASMSKGYEAKMKAVPLSVVCGPVLRGLIVSELVSKYEVGPGTDRGDERVEWGDAFDAFRDLSRGDFMQIEKKGRGPLTLRDLVRDFWISELDLSLALSLSPTACSTDEAATDEAATDEAATDEAATDEAATDEAATDEAALQTHLEAGEEWERGVDRSIQDLSQKVGRLFGTPVPHQLLERRVTALERAQERAQEEQQEVEGEVPEERWRGDFEPRTESEATAYALLKALSESHPKNKVIAGPRAWRGQPPKRWEEEIVEAYGQDIAPYLPAHPEVIRRTGQMPVSMASGIRMVKLLKVAGTGDES